LLLQRGADKRGAARDDAALGAALSSAADGGYIEIAALLIDRGANVNWRYDGPLRADWQAMPLAAALVARSSDKLTIARRRDVALALLAHGADVNARNERWQTLLHAAATAGDMPVIELLLSHGADIAPMDHDGFTPLHRAVQQGHLDAAARLIEAGADATTPAADGTTTLALASKDREMEALIRRHAKQ
ncbi:MAG TPA: ankyrin repeat domain-containing protein, partial [Vicinamibacterales bacterium]